MPASRRHHRAQERRESPDEDVDRTASAQTFQRALQRRTSSLKDRQFHQRLAVAVSDRVTHAVAGDRGRDDQHADHADVDVVLGRDDAGDQNRGLAGEDEAEEERRLAEDEQRRRVRRPSTPGSWCISCKRYETMDAASTSPFSLISIE